jgi:tetratricopeptide (TPR) repeat protein
MVRQLIFIFFISIAIATAQADKRIIPCDSIINSTAHDSLKAAAFIKKTGIYNAQNPNDALECIRQFITWAENKKKYLGTANNLMGNNYYLRGEFNTALKYYLTAQSISIDTKDSLTLGTSINNIGLVYINQGNLPEGLKYQLLSMKIRERTGDKRGVAYNYNAISVIYKEMALVSKSQDDIRNALNYQFKSLNTVEELKDSIGICTGTGNIGGIYLQLDDYGRATEYFLKSLSLSEKSNYKVGVANALGNLGSVFLMQGLNEKAIDYLERSIKLQEELGITSDLGRNIANLSKAYLNLNFIDKAIQYGNKALAIGTENQLDDLLRDAYLELSKAYTMKGDYKQANILLNNYISIKDTLTARDARNKIQEMKALFETEDKQKEITLLEEKAKVAELQSAQQQNFLRFTIGGIFLLIILALVLYNRFRVKKKASEEITAAYKIIEEKNKDIVDSVRYAARIQNSLLPTEKYIERNLKKLKEKK